MYQQPLYHHHHITSSASHGTLRPHCSTFVGPHPPQPQQPQQSSHQQPPNGKNQSLTLSASMLSNGNSSCNVTSKSEYVPLRSSADNLIKQHQMVSLLFLFLQVNFWVRTTHSRAPSKNKCERGWYSQEKIKRINASMGIETPTSLFLVSDECRQQG